MELVRTPEELEDLLEDTFVIRDVEAFADLFGQSGVLVVGDSRPARGLSDIAKSVDALWARTPNHVAEVLRVVQARDVALVISTGSISVMRRDLQRGWRYEIAVLGLQHGDGES